MKLLYIIKKTLDFLEKNYVLFKRKKEKGINLWGSSICGVFGFSFKSRKKPEIFVKEDKNNSFIFCRCLYLFF